MLDSEQRSWQGALSLTLVLQILLLLAAHLWQIELPTDNREHELLIALDLAAGTSLRSTPPASVETPPAEAAVHETTAAPPPETSEPETPQSPEVPNAPRAPTPRSLGPVPMAAANPVELPRVSTPGQSSLPLPSSRGSMLRSAVLPAAPGFSAGGSYAESRGPFPSLTERDDELPVLPEVEIGNRSLPEHAPGASAELEGPAAQRRVLRRSLPTFPAGARRSAVVRLDFVVRPDGSVGQIVPDRRVDPRFEAVAVEALRDWRFLPAPERTDRGSITFIFNLLPAR